METTTVGKMVVSARIENLFDVAEVFKGQISDDQVRRLDAAAQAAREEAVRA